MATPTASQQDIAETGLPTDRLGTIEEVAGFLGIPVATLYRWRQVGKGPKARKIGKHLRYRSSDVHAWIDAQD
ncbi:helix-turn-helix transcriptional regulator [Actinomadura rupiterrae]|uniref:helix-turn-helix transcriptional regulator n=1 Tax=Actinomadura rupiterrae TaxID=559627 RepID=UPI0020A3C1C8|nr:helix-turn-helix domain-containing protein [Actinomadura rupiterrae]MCP2340199.1 excisionase family DNA binding protein [Actinomadura rupiterrae]